MSKRGAQERKLSNPPHLRLEKTRREKRTERRGSNAATKGTRDSQAKRSRNNEIRPHQVGATRPSWEGRQQRLVVMSESQTRAVSDHVKSLGCCGSFNVARAKLRAVTSPAWQGPRRL